MDCSGTNTFLRQHGINFETFSEAKSEEQPVNIFNEIVQTVISSFQKQQELEKHIFSNSLEAHKAIIWYQLCAKQLNSNQKEKDKSESPDDSESDSGTSGETSGDALSLDDVKIAGDFDVNDFDAECQNFDLIKLACDSVCLDEFDTKLEQCEQQCEPKKGLGKFSKVVSFQKSVNECKDQHESSQYDEIKSFKKSELKRKSVTFKDPIECSSNKKQKTTTNNCHFISNNSTEMSKEEGEVSSPGYSDISDEPLPLSHTSSLMDLSDLLTDSDLQVDSQLEDELNLALENIPL